MPAPPSKLVVPQIADIHLNHPPTGKAIQQIIDYINSNVTPVPGTRKAPPNKNPGGNP